MTKTELDEVLAQHAAWLRNASEGQRANLREANLSGADLREANLSGADLSEANLSGANLREANLYEANLYGANLRGANLREANLSGADLYEANLYAANLRGANLYGAKWQATPEEIERLDVVRAIILAKPERLRMANWHSDEWTPDHTPEEEMTCGSAHCIAGWLQALSPDPAIRQLDPETAGRQLSPTAAPLFYQDDDFVLQWFKDRAYATSEATA